MDIPADLRLSKRQLNEMLRAFTIQMLQLRWAHSEKGRITYAFIPDSNVCRKRTQFLTATLGNTCWGRPLITSVNAARHEREMTHSIDYGLSTLLRYQKKN